MKNKAAKGILYAIVLVLVTALAGFAIREALVNLPVISGGGHMKLDPALFLSWQTWAVGLVATLLIFLVWLFSGNNLEYLIHGTSSGLLGNNGKADVVRGSLENSRFLTEKERDSYFPGHLYKELSETKKDGIPVRAVLNKRKMLEVNFLPGAHSLIIGATGSGKTTTFINPMIQLLGATSAGSSMIMTDPKGGAGRSVVKSYGTVTAGFQNLTFE